MSKRLASALVELLSRSELKDITVSALTKEAGVNRTSFYRRFGSLDDVVAYIYRGIMDAFAASAVTPDGGWRSVESYVRTMFAVFHSQKDVILVLHSRGLTPRLLPVMRDLFPEPSDLVTSYRTEYHLGGIMGWFNLWFDRGMCDLPEEMADMTLRMMGDTLHPMMRRFRRTRPGSSSWASAWQGPSPVSSPSRGPCRTS